MSNEQDYDYEDYSDENYSDELREDYEARQEARWREMDEIDRTGRW